jgi:uncharacterized protein (TIGR03437 family)
MIIRVATFSLLTASVALAFSAGPPVRRSGVPGEDNAATCVVCHAGTLNPDTVGGVTITSPDDYTPGITQTIRVTIRHPEALRWGFQITARLGSDTTRPAGTFLAAALTQVRCDTGGGGSAGPCGDGIRAFVEQAPAQRTDAGVGQFTYEFQWTPPASEVGEIVFFAVGNAANGDGSNRGDRIYTTTKRIALSSAAACSNPRPVLSRVVNGGSFQTGTVAPNSLVTIFGSGLQIAGRTRLAGAGDLVNGRFPSELGCLAVEIQGKRAAMIYAQSDQANLQAPADLDPGPANVVVIGNPGRPNELRSDVGTVTVAATNPAFLTFSGRSIATLLANTSTVIADPQAIPGARFARPGDVLQLYGTGFGLTEPVWLHGDVPTSIARVPGTISVTVGGTVLPAADVIYLGLSPGSISGLYQLNIRLPQGLSDGDVPVVVTVNGVATPAVGNVIPVRRQ